MQMQFYLKNVATWTTKEHADKLRQLGFKVKEEKNLKYKQHGEYYIEENRAGSITINTLNELMDFIKAYGKIVLDENTIEIYDGYRE